VIRRWDGKAWAPLASKTDHALHDVWGRNSGSVYAVGGAGTVLHFDGTAWTPLHAQAKGELRAVAGAGGYAAEGKLRPGDRFVAVDGKPIVGALGAAVKQVGDREAVFQVERVVDGQKTLVDVKLRPRYDEAAKAWRLGVILRGVGRVDVGVGTAAKEAVIYPAVQTKAILVGLYEWITGKVDGRMSSVVGIGQVVKQAIDESWVIALELLMVLNVYLGLFNLFPLPALDGGRLVFLTYEMVTRRRANPKLEATIHMAGVLVLAVLLVVVTVNDCRHL
jgi:regulator of sigma E protease